MANLDATFNNSLETVYRNQWNQYYNQRKYTNTEGQGGSRSTLEKQHRHTESLNTRRWAMARESNPDFIQFWVNPSECSWQVGLRSAVDKTLGGAIHHEIQQLDLKSGRKLANFSRLDFPTLNISFQAGIIMPGGYNHRENGPIPNIMPYGLANFYDFLSLLDQPNLTPQGTPNYVHIMYVSPVFGGRGAWLRGFFAEEGVSWTDSADDPNTITNWSAQFLVCHSNPPLNQIRRGFYPVGVR